MSGPEDRTISNCWLLMRQGVWEKDEIRKDDSFKSFEEVLQLARDFAVDCILLGGDLFHDNKPSRLTLIKAIRLIKKYCLSDKPIQFQIVSDQAASFVEGLVNYEDPNLNVGIPVFTIHGNHDDPSGQDNSSAVDVLSSCGLLNYFGKVPLAGSGVGRISLAPILIRKGETRVALYGLGNIREERLGRLFQTPGCVQWVRPAPMSDAHTEDWINVFAVHQNRVQHGAASKSCLQDRHLPPFLDLVVWGHEHECRADPESIKNTKGELEEEERLGYIIQPGSTVATALAEGEAQRKHAVLLEVMEDKWRTSKHALRSVRPFLYESVVLKEQQGLDPDRPDTITAFLEARVTSMIQRAISETPPQPGAPAMLPLIRLRVDYTGFTTINSQRFGQKFVGKLANPHDVLLWSKSAQRKVKAEGGEPEEMVRPEALDQSRIEDLIAQNLDQKLEILPEEELGAALHSYVEKDDKDALVKVVEVILGETQAAALTDPQRPSGEAAGDDEMSALMHCIQQRKAGREASSALRSAMDLDLSVLAPSVAGGAGSDDDMVEADNAVAAGPSSRRGGTAAAAASKPPTGRRGAAAAAPTQDATQGGRKGRGKAAAATGKQGTLESFFTQGGATTERAQPSRGAKRSAAIVIDSDDDDLVEEEPAPTPAASRRGRAAAAATPPKPSPRSAATRATKRARTIVIDSDDEDDLAEGDGDEDGDEEVMSDGDDDDVIEDSPPRGGRKKAAKAPAKPRASRAKPAGGGTAKGRGAAASRQPAATPAPSSTSGFIDDEPKTQPTTATQGGARRMPASFGSLNTSQRTGANVKSWGPTR